jgi:hypothetical protein
MARAAQAMGGVIGITLSSNLATRITTRMSQVGPIPWSNVGAANGYPEFNYVQWAIVQPPSHS